MNLQLVISGFPGTGKTTVYNECGHTLKISDSDSSKFSWIVDEEENKTRNPNFLKDYIEHIENILPDNDIVFVSSHEDVRKALFERGIPFIMVYPCRELKDAWIERLRHRGSPESFVKLIEDNYENWVSGLANFCNETRTTRYVIRKKDCGMKEVISSVVENVLYLPRIMSTKINFIPPFNMGRD